MITLENFQVIKVHFRSCYSTAVAMTTCNLIQTTVVGESSRKKRSDPILDQKPILKVQDSLVPYMDYISASKVMLLRLGFGLVLIHFCVIKGPGGQAK